MVIAKGAGLRSIDGHKRQTGVASADGSGKPLHFVVTLDPNLSVKGAITPVALSEGAAWEDRRHGLLLHLPRFPGSARPPARTCCSTPPGSASRPAAE